MTGIMLTRMRDNNGWSICHVTTAGMYSGFFTVNVLKNGIKRFEYTDVSEQCRRGSEHCSPFN